MNGFGFGFSQMVSLWTMFNICGSSVAFRMHMTKMSNFSPLSNTWSIISSKIKSNARDWFINRAERLGIPWKNTTLQYTTPNTMLDLEGLKTQLEDTSLEYPKYYTQPFHGYDNGNLEWNAAYEGEAATASVTADYWKGVDFSMASQWMRYNMSQHVHHYLSGECSLWKPSIRTILDVGCSIGISTEYLGNSFKQAHIIGLDLSPYFLSVAKYRTERDGTNLQYLHANAETIPFQDESIDMVSCNFLFHEVPYGPRMEILREIYRVLKPHGIIAILDLDPMQVEKQLEFNPFRKWAFEMTEPHIYDYYIHNMADSLIESGFEKVCQTPNDPINALWMGKKSLLKVHTFPIRPENELFGFSTIPKTNSLATVDV
jgi:ubiquinone/menaquinone biosynthesis C-methylase UbiE